MCTDKIGGHMTRWDDPHRQPQQPGPAGYYEPYGYEPYGQPPPHGQAGGPGPTPYPIGPPQPFPGPGPGQGYPPVPPKSVAVALLLTFLWLGVGHIYAGKTTTGVVLLIADLFLWMFSFFIITLIITVPVWFIVWVIAMVSSASAVQEYNTRLGYPRG
ncbi:MULTISPECIES: TM2 domain-containing protein [Frankia]|nr:MULTISPECIES: TM2 domain-containing protein [Frankia]